MRQAITQADVVCVIPGTSRVAHLEQNLAAADLVLTGEDIAELEAGPR